MSTATKTLIATTVKITGLSRDSLQNLLLDILASNPSVVYTAMEVDTTLETLYKVVLAEPTTSKINLIKLFREVAGFGLADSKAWSEGKTMGACDAGTFKRSMSKHDADALANEINYRATTEHVHNGYTASPTGIKVKVIKDAAFHDYRSLVNWHVEPCEF
jgi:ribosomal protein L7/L12